MEPKKLTDRLSVSPQIALTDMKQIKTLGFGTIISNRPDGEGSDQPTFEEIRDAAKKAGLKAVHVPVTAGALTDDDVAAMQSAVTEADGRVLAFCRTGTRSATLWAINEGRNGTAVPIILEVGKTAGYDLSGAARRIAAGNGPVSDTPDIIHDILIVGAGAAGIATAASLKARRGDLDIAIIDPSEAHYYQPGWTLVGAGVFTPEQTAKATAHLILKGVEWIKAAVVAFEPEKNCVIVEGCRVIGYKRLIVAPGLKLDWNGVEGLRETLGRNGVTSNYRYDLAPYTWKLVQSLKSGRAVFSQPPMPIKCAGAPQKAMYLSADHWQRTGVLDKIDIEFRNAGAVLFGVKEYVPPLMEYVARYGIDLKFNQTLKSVDGVAKTAVFEVKDVDGNTRDETVEFDMLHAVPPQTAPDFIRVSPIANEAGWVDVDQATLRHTKFENIWALGDACGAPNAKTAAAARKQAPVVAHNVVADIDGGSAVAHYDGYGSCPLTVERGKIVLAEFGYGGKLLPSFPKWIIDGTKPSRAAWFLKEKMLPPIYWKAMLKGREYMAHPDTSG